MMNNPCLVFVESNTSGTGRLFVRTTREQGYHPILLAKDPARYTYVKEDGVEVHQVNTQDEQALLKVCQQLPKLAGITSSSEYYVAIAATLADQLGLPCPNPRAIHACRNKHIQRMCLKKPGIGVPAFDSVDTVPDAVAAAKRIGLPVVVKPVQGSGSSGVKLCQTAEEVAQQTQDLLQQRHNERGVPIPQQILVEELVEGVEYSVETFNTTIIGITKKHLGTLPYFVEIGHDFPALLSGVEQVAIARTAQQALEALGLGWGPAHLELRLTAEETKIIEVNPRLAGGYIPELVRLAWGIDLIAETIRQVVGNEPQLNKLVERYACLRFILPPVDGTLVGVDGLDSAQQVPGVAEIQLYLQSGDTVKCRGDFRDRIGHVIAVGDTSTNAKGAVELAHSQIQLQVEPNLSRFP